MKTLKIAGFSLAGVQLVLSVLVVYFAFSTKMVPTAYGIGLIVGLAILLGVVILLSTRKKKATNITAIVIAAILSILYAIASYYIYVTNKTIDDVTGVNVEVDEINVYVSKDDTVASINEAVANGYVFGTVSTDDQQHIQETVSKIEGDVSQTVNTREYETIFDLIAGFENNEVQALIINKGTLYVLDASEEYIDYSQNLKIIMETMYEEEIVQEEESTSMDDDHFCVYFSGIDTFGSVTAKSRSDVNIIAVVNNQTKQVLLISTPRDYYVPLSNSKGKKDKLTHAGLYGIECSMDTLEMLYDADLSNYVRINFSGFQNIINQLGGIDVNSEYAFTSETEEGIYSFSKGINHLNGEEALGFARSRNFTDGDRQRGRNQMQVIKATIEKLESPETLKNYSNIMDSMEGSFQTDMSKDHIGYLVQSTLTDGNWEVLTYSVGGNDSTQTCYSTGSTQLYVMVPNEDDITYANELISRVLSGDKVSQDEINVYIENKDAEDLIDNSAVEQDGSEEDTEE